MAVVEKPTGQKSAGLTLRARWLLVAMTWQHTEQKKNGVKKEKWRYKKWRYSLHLTNSSVFAASGLIEWQKERVPDGDTLCYM